MKYPEWWKEVKYFKPEEFKCKCCGEMKMQAHFVRWLDRIRHAAGIPFVITSGYRCEKHNAEVGGIAGSAHTKGVAADIYTPKSPERYEILRAMIEAKAQRIGIGQNFIHVDLDPSKPTRVIWLYPNKN